jgi:hypothetical protein
MEFERRSRASQGGSTTNEVTGSAGKRTLTEGLSSNPAWLVGPGAASFTPRAPGAQSVIQRKDERAATQVQGQEAPTDPRGVVINNLLESFQSIDVEVPVPNIGGPHGQVWEGNTRKTHAHAKIPYWNNKYVKEVNGERLDPPRGFDGTERGRVLGALGIGVDDAVATGKGFPGEIGGVVMRAIAAGLVPRPGYAPVSQDEYWAAAWRPIIEAWLLKVGIGLDCNGFVYQALHAVNRAGAETTGHGILDYYPNEDLSRTRASLEAMAGLEGLGLGLEVRAPDELQVADIMMITGHIRIIMDVRRADGVTSFTTAESTADGRYQRGGAISGPRVHYWRYTPDGLEHQYEGSAEWHPSGEGPIYRRHVAPAAAGQGSGGNVQRKAAGAATAAPGEALASAGPGAPLPAATRSKMEGSFGADFASVRVHQGDAAPALGAQAFADGESVHFAPGRYQPGSQSGDALIGHELAHVVQQREGRVASPQGKDAAVVDDSALEAEADRMGEAAAAGQPARERGSEGAQTTAAEGRAVQRKEEDSVDGSGLAPSGDSFDADVAAVDALFPPTTKTRPAASQLQAPVGKLVKWCRDHLPNKDRIEEYLRSSVAHDDKVATIGKLGNELTRMEFMLGALYNGSTTANWRSSEGSVETFLAKYLTAVEVGSGEDWCTAFAGFGFGRLGGDKSVTRALGSGLKQRATGEVNEANPHGAVVFPQDSWHVVRHLIMWNSAQAQSANRVITPMAVDALVRAFVDDAPGLLAKLDPPGTGGRGAFEQFLYNQQGADRVPDRVILRMKARDVPTTVPVPGDLLILNSTGNASGQNDDHTAMIDRYSFPILSTLEGNLGDKTGTRQLDLSKPEHLAKIYFISRPASQIVAQSVDAGKSDPAAGAAQLQELQRHNERIFSVYSKLTAAGKAATSYGQPVATWNK